LKSTVEARITTAGEYLTKRKEKYPPQVAPVGGGDRAQRLYDELAPSLPDELRNLFSTGATAVGEIGINRPIVHTVEDGQVVEFYSGMLDFTHAVVRTLAGLNVHVAPHREATKRALSIEEITHATAHLFRHWRWPNRWLPAIRRIDSTPFPLEDFTERWARDMTVAVERFLLAHELGHVILAHKLTDSLFEKEEVSADALGGAILRRFADGGGDDFARLFGGSVLALRIFAALEAVGVRFEEQYPDQGARLESYWTFMHKGSPSHQYFYEASRIAVAYLKQMDDVVALLGGKIETRKPDDQRILAIMIGMLLELSRQAVERKDLVDYITHRAADTPKDILQNALQALCRYYLDSPPPKDAFFDPQTNRRMGRALRTVLPDLSADVRKMCQ
jgi:hypothetical protein